MAKRMTKARKRKAVRSIAGFSTVDDFLKDEGKLEEFEAIAIKEVIWWCSESPSTSFCSR
jgi:hypothetical protein